MTRSRTYEELGGIAVVLRVDGPNPYLSERRRVAAAVDALLRATAPTWSVIPRHRLVRLCDAERAYHVRDGDRRRGRDRALRAGTPSRARTAKHGTVGPVERSVRRTVRSRNRDRADRNGVGADLRLRPGEPGDRLERMYELLRRWSDSAGSSSRARSAAPTTATSSSPTNGRPRSITSASLQPRPMSDAVMTSRFSTGNGESAATPGRRASRSWGTRRGENASGHRVAPAAARVARPGSDVQRVRRGPRVLRRTTRRARGSRRRHRTAHRADRGAHRARRRRRPRARRSPLGRRSGPGLSGAALRALARRAVLVILCARPSGQAVVDRLAPAATLALPPLPPSDLARIGTRLGLDPETAERAAGWAGGNPLFVEQFSAWFGETHPQRSDALPTTLRDVIAARLDHLRTARLEALRDRAGADAPVRTRPAVERELIDIEAEVGRWLDRLESGDYADSPETYRYLMTLQAIDRTLFAVRALRAGGTRPLSNRLEDALERILLGSPQQILDHLRSQRPGTAMDDLDLFRCARYAGRRRTRGMPGRSRMTSSSSPPPLFRPKNGTRSRLPWNGAGAASICALQGTTSTRRTAAASSATSPSTPRRAPRNSRKCGCPWPCMREHHPTISGRSRRPPRSVTRRSRSLRGRGRRDGAKLRIVTGFLLGGIDFGLGGFPSPDWRRSRSFPKSSFHHHADRAWPVRLRRQTMASLADRILTFSIPFFNVVHRRFSLHDASRTLAAYPSSGR